MSCLNLRLPPARKAWKNFTSKLQSKLFHKLHKTRAIKKAKYELKTPSSKAVKASDFMIRQNDRRKKQHLNPSPPFPFKRRSRRLHFLKKSSSPVYIDQLFREPASELVVKRPLTGKNVKLRDQQARATTGAAATASGTSKEEAKAAAEKGSVADDMWESLGFASPLMRGIDERAEQFIVRFREEMEVQEMIARGL